MVNIFKKVNKHYEIEEFQKYNILGIYTNKNHGSLAPYHSKDGLKNLEKFLTQQGLDKKILVWAKQTHSDKIVTIREDIEDYYEGVDGFITQRDDIVIATFYADCLPIYAYDRKNKVFGLCHSGWLGTSKKIGLKMIEAMVREYGSKVEDISIAFGIGMQGEVYEVSADFIENFRENFDLDLYKDAFIVKGDKYYFDNQQFNKIMLEGIGIKDVITNDLCTYQDDEFHSHRREGTEAGRNAAIITKI